MITTESSDSVLPVLEAHQFVRPSPDVIRAAIDEIGAGVQKIKAHLAKVVSGAVYTTTLEDLAVSTGLDDEAVRCAAAVLLLSHDIQDIRAADGGRVTFFFCQKPSFVRCREHEAS